MKDEKLIYIDLETGGVNSYKNPVIQIAGIVEINGKIKQQFDLRTAPFPHQEIEDSSLEVTGLTRSEIKGYDDPSTVFDTLTTMLDKYVDRYDSSDKFHFVGYNSTFDDRFMRAFWKNNNDKYYGSFFYFPTIDVCVLAADQLKSARPLMNGFKLVDVAEHFFDDVNADDAHDASWDIKMTRRIYKHLKTKDNQQRFSANF